MRRRAAGICAVLALLAAGCGRFGPAEWPDAETRAEVAPDDEEACDD